MSKNLQKVQDMLDGKGTGKIQVGQYSKDIHANRKLGERYFDHDDKEWEKTEYGRVSVSKLPSKGLYDNYCSDCKKGIVKPWDKEIFKFNDRCYYCQIDFEAELKTSGKFDEWKKKQDTRIKEDYIEKFEAENKELIEEIKKLENPFDMSVANALANGEVEVTINKNKS
tara:strand:- start:58 stop:564 length:507 start_codon:yes stop_codon:yes gene_type:complete